MPGSPLPGDQLIESPQEGRQGFTASGGCSDEQMFARCNFGPGLLLDIRGLADLLLKPPGDQRVK
jgi:hypothetical protein